MSEPAPVKSVTMPKYVLYPAWVVLGVFAGMMLVTNPLLFLFIVALSIVWPTLSTCHHYVHIPTGETKSDEKPKENDNLI